MNAPWIVGLMLLSAATGQFEPPGSGRPPTIVPKESRTEIRGDSAPRFDLRLDPVQFEIDLRSFRFEIDDVVQPASRCEVTRASVSCDLEGVANGEHRFTFFIGDIVGNSGAWSQLVRLWIDETPPSVTITSPLAGTWVTDQALRIEGRRKRDRKRHGRLLSK